MQCSSVCNNRRCSLPLLDRPPRILTWVCRTALADNGQPNLFTSPPSTLGPFCLESGTVPLRYALFRMEGYGGEGRRQDQGNVRPESIHQQSEEQSLRVRRANQDNAAVVEQRPAIPRYCLHQAPLPALRRHVTTCQPESNTVSRQTSTPFAITPNLIRSPASTTLCF